MVRVFEEACPCEEDQCCEKEQGRDDIDGGGACSSHAGKVLQLLDFGNPVSPDNMDHFIGNDSFYEIGIFVLWCVVFCVIMTMSLPSFIQILYFCLLILITEMNSPPSTLVICPLDLSLGGVLILLELLLCEVSGGPNSIESWSSSDRKIQSIFGVLSKRVLYVLDFNVSRFTPIIGLKA